MACNNKVYISNQIHINILKVLIPPNTTVRGSYAQNVVQKKKKCSSLKRKIIYIKKTKPEWGRAATTILLASNNNTQCYQLEQKEKLVRNTSLSTGMSAAKGKLKKRFAHSSIGQGTSDKGQMKALGAFFASVSIGKDSCQSSWLSSPSSRAWAEKCCPGRGTLS